MLSNEEVLAALSVCTPPEELANLLARVLRVPEAWARLRDPDFLHRVQAAKPGWGLPDLLPLELQVADVRSQGTFPTALTQELEEVWDTALRGGKLDRTFHVVALLAASVVHKAAASDLPADVIAQLTREPEVWTSALACAYSWLPSSERVVSQLLARGDPSLLRVVVTVLLANMAEVAAAGIIAAAASPGILVEMIGSCRDEWPLLRALARRDVARPPSGTSHDQSAGLASSLGVACREWADSAPDRAHQTFSQAWEDASSHLAKVADLFADFAEETADTNLALEARREALRIRPSSGRRANLALSLVSTGKEEEVPSLLSADNATACERVALAMAQCSAGHHAIAAQEATELWESALDMRRIDPQWAERLASIFSTCGHRDQEAAVRTAIAEGRPYAPAAQIACATSLIDAGDPHSAADIAFLAHALDPRSTQASASLAASLQAAGRPEDALLYWQELANCDAGFNERLAECALEAGAWDALLTATPDETKASSADPKSIALRGIALSRMGDYSRARSLLDAALEQHPHSGEVWLAHAECQSLQGDDQAAGLTLATASQAVPTSSRVQLAYAEWLADHGRPSEAALAAQRGVALEASPGRAHLHLARYLTSLGRHDESRQTLHLLLERYPRMWDARQAMAMNFVAAGELQAAARAVDSVPHTARPEAHFFAGSLQIQASLDTGDMCQLERGRSMLTVAREKGFTSPELYAYLARAHEKSGNWDAVQEACERCLDMLPEGETRLREEATLGLARAALARNLIPQAISGLRLARSRFPDSAALHTLLARAHLKAAQPLEAIAAAETASHLEPSSAQSIRVLADAADTAGDWPLARDTIRRLLSLAPSDVDTWLRLARVSLRAGDDAETRSAVAQALHLGRRHPSVLHDVARILADMQSPRSAQRMLRYAAHASPTDPAVLADLGGVSEQMGDSIAAEQAWTRLAHLQPANFEALSHAGAALWSQSKAAEALDFWQQAYALDPANPSLLVSLARASLACGDPSSAISHYLEASSASRDPDLYLEAGRAIMTHGSPREAVEVLARAVATASGRWEPLAALGECLIRLNRPADAARALQRASRLEAPSGVFAMLAIAFLEAGSPDEAHFALDRSISLAQYSPGDAIWVSQAAARLGDWQAAVQALGNSPTSGSVSETPVAREELSLRIADAKWLYDAADADSYKALPAPPEGAQSSSAFHASEGGSERAHLIEIRRRSSQGRLTDADLEEWRRLEALDVTGESREGLAIAFLRKGDPTEALRVLHVSEEKRYRPWTDILTGLCLERLGRPHEAYLAFHSARPDPAHGPLAEYLMGRSLQAEGDLANSAAHLNSAVTAVPDQPRWHYQLALTYRESGKADASVPHFQRAAELDADNSEYALALARALQQTGHRADAFQAYERALPAFSTDAAVVTEAAEAALATGDTRRSASHFAHALELAPDNARALLGAARAALSANRIRQAHQYAEKAFHHSPQDPSVMTVLAEILVHEGDSERALKAYKHALRHSENPVPIYSARSDLLIQAGRAPKAIEELLEATHAFPAAEDLWASLATAYEASEQLDKSLEAAEKAMALSPSDPSMHLLVGRISRKLGQLDRALSELKAAADQSADTPHAQLELGILLEARRDIQGALDNYRRAIDIDRRCIDAYLRAGILLKEIKSYSEAAEMFRHASALDPLDPTILHQLAAVRALELVHGGNLPSMVST